MRDIDVFSKLLNLQAPWKVDRISLVPEQHRLDVWLAHRRNASFPCPECGIRSPLYDHIPSKAQTQQ